MDLPVVTPALTQGQKAVAVDAAMVTKLVDKVGDLAVNLAIAAAILVATLFIAKWAARGVERAVGRLKASRRDKTLSDLASTLVRTAVVGVGLIAVLQRLGVQTTSIIAVLGAASLALGLALQGTLSNVAAGVMLLVLRPFKVGDNVLIADQSGTVKRIALFATYLATADNLRVVLPNSKVFGDVIVNRTYRGTRRIELNVNVDYDSDLEQVFTTARRILVAHPRVLNDPPVWAGLLDLGDFALVVRLHAWVKSGDWWDVSCDLRRAIKEGFDAEGILFPYPHQIGLSRAEFLGEGKAEAAKGPAPAARRSPPRPTASQKRSSRDDG